MIFFIFADVIFIDFLFIYLSSAEIYTESQKIFFFAFNCTARQCLPLRRKFMECYIIKTAQSLLIKHLVIGQR